MLTNVILKVGFYINI